MPRLELEAKEYQRGLRTHGELVWDAWTASGEDTHGIADRVESLRVHLSPAAFAAAQEASRQELAMMGDDSTGFLPYRFLCPDTEMEAAPEFVPRTFIERLATEAQDDEG